MFILHVVQACQNIMIFCSFVVFAFCTLIFIFVACAIGCHIKKIIDKTHVNKFSPIFVVSGLHI